jgi:methyltransferase family protein
MDLKIKAILSGLSTHIPWYDRKGSTGGTDSARYCYSVWLRHLVLGARHAKGWSQPRVVAELGPGDSIGIGLAALLSGAEKYFALDLVQYSDLKKNLEIFDELVSMFANQLRIPDDSEFPFLYPKLDCYDFPKGLIGESRLLESLAPERVAGIRSAIELSGVEGSKVSYKAPWNAPDVIDDESVDFIFSQAVLEHVDDLKSVYAAMRKWLKPNGMMTHQIDFQCHGKANTWNGHWTYSDFVWKVVVGRRSYLLNRQPHSVHVDLIRRSGFQILDDTVFRSVSHLRREQLAPRFRALSDDDLSTSGAFIVAASGRGV